MMLAQKKFQAHRGYWVEGLTENTLEALAAARARGSEMVEFDVRLSKDYVPVLYHDPTLKRLHKAAVNVRDLTLKQLRIFAPDLTTLEEVLTSREVPDQLNIELKTDAVADPALEIRVTQLVRQFKAEERVVFSAFNPLSLVKTRQLAPEIARALLVTQERQARNFWFMRQMSLLPMCDAQFLHWDQRMTTQERVQQFLELGYKIAVYTVNDEKQAEEFLSWGVGSIISDRLLTAP